MTEFPTDKEMQKMIDDLLATPAEEKETYHTQNAGPVDSVRAGRGGLKGFCLSLDLDDLLHGAYSIENSNTPKRRTATGREVPGDREIIMGFGEDTGVPIKCPGCGEERKDRFLVLTNKSWVIECSRCRHGWFVPRNLESLSNQLLDEKFKADMMMRARQKHGR